MGVRKIYGKICSYHNGYIPRLMSGDKTTTVHCTHDYYKMVEYSLRNASKDKTKPSTLISFPDCLWAPEDLNEAKSTSQEGAAVTLKT